MPRDILVCEFAAKLLCTISDSHLPAKTALSCHPLIW